jgi:hypothetical protein
MQNAGETMMAFVRVNASGHFLIRDTYAVMKRLASNFDN